MYFWFRSLEAIIPQSQNQVLRTFKAMLVDQLLFCPIFTGVYFAYNGYLEGGCVDAVKYKFRFAYIPTLIANYKLWPAVQLINFYLVPLPYRVPFVNIVALGWNVYISTINARYARSIDHTLIK